MLFNSFWYLVFLPTVVTLFWVSPRVLRTFILVAASYVFYCSWKPIYGLLILGMTLINFAVGLAIAKAAKPESDASAKHRRKTLLICGIALNLILLGVFKYAYFTWDLVQTSAGLAGQHLPPLPWSIILPLGISFFVFEFIHYLSDVYKGGKPVKGFLDFALFASFFPTQIAGPIKRYQDFVPQLKNDARFGLDLIDSGLSLIIFGLFKKVVFADNLAVVVQSAFSRPDLLSGVDMWIAVYAFAFQIYFDFSGYTDIARGSAWLFGYKVPPNFDLPYLATSMTDFWRRWHISLSSWLRDYLFIPLGGSRGNKLFTCRNLLLTMVLGGLWHGAALHFVVWGAYQGIMLIVHKECQRWSDSIAWFAQWKQTRTFYWLSVLLTFHLVCIGWVFFRADTFAIAADIIRKLFFLDHLSSLQAFCTQWSLSIVNTNNPVIFMLLPFVLLLLVAGQILSAKLASMPQRPQFPPLLKGACYAAMVVLLLVLSPDTSPKFIYFQF